MFCPKCGSQNVDESRFCRGCGADLTGVLAVIEGKPALGQPVAEKQIDLFSSGVRNVVLAFGFAVFSLIIFLIPGDTHFWVVFLVPVMILLASGISRILKANGLKELREEEAKRLTSRQTPVLAAGRQDYIEPSIYETDDLLKVPSSVTEGTTRNLKSSE